MKKSATILAKKFYSQNVGQLLIHLGNIAKWSSPIGTFSIIVCFLYSGIYSSNFSCFYLSSNDVIVISGWFFYQLSRNKRQFHGGYILEWYGGNTVRKGMKENQERVNGDYSWPKPDLLLNIFESHFGALQVQVPGRIPAFGNLWLQQLGTFIQNV